MIRIVGPLKFVAVYKVAEAATPLIAAAELNDYSFGCAGNAHSLPVAYSLTGWLLHPPVVGEVVHVLRRCRNGVVCPGIFSSTEVVATPRDGEFHTRNSIYRYEEMDEPNLLADALPSRVLIAVGLVRSYPNN